MEREGPREKEEGERVREKRERFRSLFISL